jgi:chloride channel 3/4/5
MFQVSYTHSWHDFELIPFILLGIFGGLYGSLFIHAVQMWTSFRARSGLNKYPTIDVLLVTILSATVSYNLWFTRIGINELVADLISECQSEDDLNGLCRYI